MSESAPILAARILIVEDDDFIAMLYADSLCDMGHGVCAIAATEQAAIAAAERYQPDFMIVDGSLRAGSGLAAVAEILRGSFVPHLFVSGDVARIEAQIPDANILQKPFRTAELGAAIQRVLARLPRS